MCGTATLLLHAMCTVTYMLLCHPTFCSLLSLKLGASKQVYAAYTVAAIQLHRMLLDSSLR
jgi:hypothetical protein